jgi:hypothetical protein
MPPLKTSYTALTHRVVRESREPLPFLSVKNTTTGSHSI